MTDLEITCWYTLYPILIYFILFNLLVFIINTKPSLPVTTFILNCKGKVVLYKVVKNFHKKSHKLFLNTIRSSSCSVFTQSTCTSSDWVLLRVVEHRSKIFDNRIITFGLNVNGCIRQCSLASNNAKCTLWHRNWNCLNLLPQSKISGHGNSIFKASHYWKSHIKQQSVEIWKRYFFYPQKYSSKYLISQNAGLDNYFSWFLTM